MHDPGMWVSRVQEGEVIAGWLFDLDEWFGCKETDGPAELFIRWWQGSLTEQQSFVLKVIAWGIVMVLVAMMIPRGPSERK